MANSFDSTLVTAVLKEGLVTVAQNRLAPISAFSREFGVDQMKPLSVVEVKKATAGSTTQTNATNFESGDSTVDPISVTVNQYTQSFQISNADAQNGLKLSDLVAVNAGAFCDKLCDVVYAVLTTANFTNTPIVVAPATFDLVSLQTAYASIKKAPSKAAILDSDYYAKFSVQNDVQNRGVGVTGWQGFYENTRWTGAGANVRGFFTGQDAIGVASGLPVEPAGSDFISVDTVTLPGIGMTVVYHVWFSRSTRTLWASYDVMLGAAAGDVSVLTLLKDS